MCTVRRNRKLCVYSKKEKEAVCLTDCVRTVGDTKEMEAICVTDCVCTVKRTGRLCV